jgi:hypothetical protein
MAATASVTAISSVALASMDPVVPSVGPAVS